MPLLSTVKSKTAATSAPSASASTAPASQAPASQAPSAATDVSAAPSADPSAVPSADVSASPSADVSAEPSVEPSKEPSKVSEIKILNETALTNEKGTEAYIYYDVVDQYGESMRTSTDIQWTTSPASKKVDKAAGKITLTTTEDNKFTYGQQVFINGVHAKTGVVKQASLTIGMTQAVDTIKFAGFVNKNDLSKVLDSLPAAFAVKTYYMVFTTYDQNGNALDVTEDNYASENLVFICDNPMLLDIQSSNAKLNVTVKDTDYAAIPVEPGSYVDKGGETNITAIASKTGAKTNINVVVGGTPQLKSVELQAPSETVADGDQDIKIPYVAKDVNGNTVTNYETLVRGSNKLTLSAGDTTLKVKEENDGTAGIYWSDNSKYKRTNTSAYAESEAGNGIDRMVALTTIVVGGESNNLMLSVSDMRIPSAITDVSWIDDYISNGKTGSNSPFADAWWAGGFSYKDQYGKDMDAAEAKAFFRYADGSTFGSDKLHYAIRLKVPSTGSKCITTDKEDDKDTGYMLMKGEWGGWHEYAWKAALAKTDKVTTEALKFSIVTTDKSSPKIAEWNDASKIFTKTVTIVPRKDLQNLRIEGLETKAEYGTVSSDGKAKTDVVTETVERKSNGKYKIYGTYQGNKIQIENDKDFVTEGAGSAFALETEVTKDGDTVLKADNGALLLGKLQKSVTYGDLFDYSNNSAPAKDATFENVIQVTAENYVADSSLTTNQTAAQTAYNEAVEAYNNYIATANANIAAKQTALESDQTTYDSKLADFATAKAAVATKYEAVKTAIDDTKDAYTTAKSTENDDLAKVNTAATGVGSTAATTASASIDTAYADFLGSLLTTDNDGSLASTANSAIDKAIATFKTAGGGTELDNSVAVLKSDINTLAGLTYVKGTVAALAADKAYAKLATYADYADDANTESAKSKAFVAANYAIKTAVNDTASGSAIVVAVANVNNGNTTASGSAVEVAVKAAQAVYTAAEDVETAETALATAKKDLTGEEATALKDAVTKAKKTLDDANEKIAGQEGVTVINQDVTISVSPASAAKIESADGILNPSGTSTKGVVLAAAEEAADHNYAGDPHALSNGPAVYCANGWAHSTPRVWVTDQYGNTMTDVTVVYTISDIVENEAEFAHVKGNATVQKNGTSEAYVEGAELGDTFKVTAKVKGTTLTTTFNVTVGADKSAYIANGDDNDAKFRVAKLGYKSES